MRLAPWKRVRVVNDYETLVLGIGVSWREREVEVRFGPWGLLFEWGDE